MQQEESPMTEPERNPDPEALMRRWQQSTELAMAAWVEYQHLADPLREANRPVRTALARWRTAERQRRRWASQLRAAEAAVAG